MEDLLTNIRINLNNHLTRSLERLLEEANQSGELRLNNRKLKDFPKLCSNYNLSDTVAADISKNRLTELPEELLEYTFLEKLVCHHNAIRYISDTISNFHCLNYIDLSRNQLVALPKEICLLPVQVLLLSNNRLECLPDELCRMSQLAELDASGNQLTHLPPRMGDLTSLKSLILRSNLLLCVPFEITILNLIKLDLRANRIGTLPVDMINMTSLVDLLLEDNPLISPPITLCRRGRVHIFKFLENEAAKLDHKVGVNGGGTNSNNNTLARKSKRIVTTTGSSLCLSDQLSQRKLSSDSNNVASEERSNAEKTVPNENSNNGLLSQVGSTESDAAKLFHNHSSSKKYETKPVETQNRCYNTSSESAVGSDTKKQEKSPSFQSVQTYREYKEALKQQRANDSSSVYRVRDSENNSYKTEPNTPTHMVPTQTALATSKSDPTPLNAVLCSPKVVFEDINNKKSVQKASPSRYETCASARSSLHNNVKESERMSVTYSGQDYIKPKSPVINSYKSNVESHSARTSPLANTKNIMNSKGNTARVAETINYFNSGSKAVNGVKTFTERSNEGRHTFQDSFGFTMKREIDKAKEESEMIKQLRNIIETRLKMELPDDVGSALTDGVVLCHLANHIKPRSIASIHVPSPAVPKLTMARCRRNVDNFIDACRRIGVDEGRLCSSVDVTEGLAGRGLPRLLETVESLCQLEVNTKRSTLQELHSAIVSLLLLSVFFGIIALVIIYPPPN